MRAYLDKLRGQTGYGQSDVRDQHQRSADQNQTQSGNPMQIYNQSPNSVNRGYQNQGLGRYHPPMMDNSGGWQDSGGYTYNLPNNYGPFYGAPFSGNEGYYPTMPNYQDTQQAYQNGGANQMQSIPYQSQSNSGSFAPAQNGNTGTWGGNLPSNGANGPAVPQFQKPNAGNMAGGNMPQTSMGVPNGQRQNGSYQDMLAQVMQTLQSRNGGANRQQGMPGGMFHKPILPDNAQANPQVSQGMPVGGGEAPGMPPGLALALRNFGFRG